MFFWFGFVLPYCVLLLCHCHCAIEASIAHCVAQPCISNALFAVALRGDIRSLHCSLFWFFLVPPLKADIAARVYHVTLRGGMAQSPLLQFGWQYFSIVIIKIIKMVLPRVTGSPGEVRRYPPSFSKSTDHPSALDIELTNVCAEQ